MWAWYVSLGLLDSTGCVWHRAEPRGRIELNDSSLSVLETGAVVPVVVCRVNGSFAPASARVQTNASSSTAAAGADYTALDVEVQWAHYEHGCRSVNLVINDDSLVDASEIVVVQLADVVGSSVGSDRLEVLLTDDGALGAADAGAD